MAVESLAKVSFVVRKSELKSFRDYLYKLGLVHIRDISSLSESPKIDLEEEKLIRENLAKVEYSLKVIDEIAPESQAFIENFIPKKPIFTINEVKSIKENFNLNAFYLNIKSNFENKRAIEERIASLKLRIEDLKPFQNFNFRFETLRKNKRIRVLFFYSSKKTIKELLNYTYLIENSMILKVPKEEEIFGFMFIVPTSKCNELIDIIKRIPLSEINFSDLEGTPLENIDGFQKELSLLEKNKSLIEEELRELCKEKDKIILFSDILRSEIFKCEAVKAFADSKRVSLIEGYIPLSLRQELINSLKTNYPKIYFEIEEAKKDPFVPVKLKNNNFFRPFEFLIRMFGVPKYGEVDPTPFTAILFLVLFGIAFGDLFYGLFLSLACLYFMKRYYYDKGTVDFFKIFYYTGLSASFFGLITGSWGGDLISESYLSPNSLILKVKNSLIIIDPLKNIMAMLVAIVILGVVSQMYGIFIAILSNIKDRNYKDAIFDQLSWLIFIPGGVVVAGNFLAKEVFPQKLVALGLTALVIGIIMIFIGGFLKSKSPINRIIKGFLNIYGILSSYGVSSFLADSLSYLRLLALSVATSSMAMSFNLVAFMFKDIKVIGPIFVILVLIITHLLNLLLSILGAFVHPVRLLFYEFFGRFYGDGGNEFRAFSEIRKNVIVKEELE